MTRAVAAVLLLVPGAGCLHFQPVGPLAKSFGGADSGPKVAAAPDAPAPTVEPAKPPAPPALMVSPAEVSDASYQDAVRRLTTELEADRRALDAMSRYSDVSVIKK